MKRYFRVGEGRTLTLPVGLVEGAANTRVHAGDVIELEVARINGHADRRQNFHRFVLGRVRAGDLVELPGAPAASSAPASASVAQPADPSKEHAS